MQRALTRSRFVLSVALLAAPWAVACFEPEIAVCLRCSDACPRGQECVDGRCQKRPQQCRAEPDGGGAWSEAGAEVVDAVAGPLCLGTSCWSAEPAQQVLTWLDWSSLPGAGAPFAASERFEWRDRSGLGHPARLAPGAPLAHASAVVQGSGGVSALALGGESGAYLVLDAESGDALDALGASDFFALLGVASCDQKRRDCFLHNMRAANPAGGEARAGFSVGLSPQGMVVPRVPDCRRAEDAEEPCAPALASAPSWTCSAFHLVAARLRTLPAGRVFETRLDGRLSSLEGIAEGTTLDSDQPLSIGGGGSCQELASSIALLAVVQGPMADSEVERLEQFAMHAMAEAGLSTATYLGGAVP